MTQEGTTGRLCEIPYVCALLPVMQWDVLLIINTTSINNHLKQVRAHVNIKQSLYRPGQAQRVPIS